MRYSISTGCFYPEWGEYGEQLPSDVVTVPDEDLEIALGRSANQEIKIVDGRVTLSTKEQTLAEQKTILEYEAQQIFNTETSAPVEVIGIMWKGGESSVSTIIGAVSLANVLGENEVLLVDVNDEEHTLTIQQATQVAATIGMVFRAAYFKHKSALRDIKEM